MIIEAQMIIGACDRRKKDENEKVSISNGCDFDQFVCFYVELGQSRRLVSGAPGPMDPRAKRVAIPG
jgi:hypothetical protein